MFWNKKSDVYKYGYDGNNTGTAPDWFWTGMDAVMLAPTAMNQQKFLFTYDDGRVQAKVSSMGFYTKLDLGIAEYHFEAATGRKIIS